MPFSLPITYRREIQIQGGFILNNNKELAKELNQRLEAGYIYKEELEKYGQQLFGLTEKMFDVSGIAGVIDIPDQEAQRLIDDKKIEAVKIEDKLLVSETKLVEYLKKQDIRSAPDQVFKKFLDILSENAFQMGYEAGAKKSNEYIEKLEAMIKNPKAD